jgi:hypothetical protein
MTLLAWNEMTFVGPAEGGHLHVLKWQREENNPPCPWDESICANAAEGGHLHVLKKAARGKCTS